MNINGTDKADVLLGTAGADTIHGGSGDDTIDGGDGIDTAVYGGTKNSYNLSRTAIGFTLEDPSAIGNVSGNDGTDALVRVERLKFSDTSLALDLDGAAGMVAKVLGAVFGSSSTHDAGYVGIGLSLADGGMSYDTLIRTALDARLGEHASNRAVVELLYVNMLDTSPTDAERDYYVALLDSGSQTQVSLAKMVAELALNASKIDLPGLVDTGIAFTPA